VGKVPKLIGIQSAACALLRRPLKRESVRYSPSRNRKPLLKALRLAKPVRGSQILEVIRETRGKILSVNRRGNCRGPARDGEKGYFIEPTSAATIAGLKKYGKHIKKEVIVTTLTGTGLKATEKIGHL